MEHAKLWLVMGSYLGTLVVLFLTILKALNTSQTWSLGDSISEEVELSVSEAMPDKKATKLVPSSSRFIALLGGAAVLSVFIGFSTLVIWDAVHGQSDLIDRYAPSLLDLVLYGSALFIPYGINKASSIFQVFSGNPNKTK